jgi:hypothetical protein
VPLPTQATAAEPVLTGRKAAVAGGLTALVALAALGLAGAARGSTTLAACAELVRFPFPHFRVLRCPGVSAATVADNAPVAGTTAHGQSRSIGPPRPIAKQSPHVTAVSEATVPPLPKIGGILGTNFSKAKPWQLLKALVLAMLAAANALLLTVRWRVGRVQGR